MTLPAVGLSSGANFLRDAACRLLAGYYDNPRIRVGEAINRNLNWTPAARFTVRDVHYCIEPSEEDCYPEILRLRYLDLVRFPEPIAVYCACPEEVCLAATQQGEIRILREHGFGLIAITQSGDGDLRVRPIPLIQMVPDEEFKQHLRGLPRRVRQELIEAFESYKHKPYLGVANVSEVLEGLVLQAGRDALNRQLIQRADLRNIASTLDALYEEASLQNARAAIGGARAFMKAHRNPAHHWPKNKKEAYRKYRDSRHGFLEGLRQIAEFREAMKGVGLTGNLAKP